MAYTKPGSPFLFDETTNDIVGFKDRDTSEVLLSSVSGGGAAPTAAPYRLGSYGDSRANGVGSTQIGPAGTGTSFSLARVPAWVAAVLGDTEYCANFGVSGDILISAGSTNGWNGQNRLNSKTIGNFLSLGLDVAYIQYGINDLPAATSAALITEAKRLVSALLAGGLKVCLDGIMLFDPTAATPNISPANAAATLVKINEFSAAMSAWMAPMVGRAVFVNSTSAIALASTGYADPQYMTTADTLGVHPSKRGCQIMAPIIAAAIRTMLPAKSARTYTLGPNTSLNLIDWANPTMFGTQIAGTVAFSTPTWNMDAATGVPYAEITMTPSALASGTAQGRFEIQANDIAGATPKFAISIGDVFQASARITIDDGNGGVAPVQSVQLRQRLYNNAAASQIFSDWGQVTTTDLTTLPALVDVRATTPAVATPIASATIATPAVGSGFYLAAFIETTTLAPVRCRLYAPSLRVVSRPQPAAITPGASPYLWQNNPQPFAANDFVNSTGRDVQVTVFGGTVSQIAIGRGPTVAGSFLNAVNTGATSGVFILKPGDGIVVTYTVAPTMTQLII